MKKIALFASGRGSNLMNILASMQNGCLANLAEAVLVFSNQPQAPVLAKAEALGLAVDCIPSRGKKRLDFDAEVLDLLEKYRPDYIVLAGYMRVLSAPFVAAYAGRIVNIHPADTQVHQGLGAYKWAFDQGLEETKITVHLVDQGLDTGPIIAQAPVNLAGAKDLAEVERRGLAVEHQLYPQALYQLFSSSKNKQ